MFVLLLSTFLASGLQARAQTYSATYLPSTVPDQTEQGQYGTNRCGTGSNQTSVCQNLYINSVDDFCLFAPPQPGAASVIGNTEQIEVAWCMKSGYGTRLIPDGSMKGAHFVQTPDYVQVTGIGDLTSLNVPAGDAGGELDPHGATGNGNPIGGLVFSSAFGQLQQIHEWTNFMSATQFCIRACKPGGPNAPGNCQHIYDVMGCDWNMPANYDAGTFENCQGDSSLPMGVYSGSTFYQGQPNTPSAHPVPSSSLCTTLSSIGSGQGVASSPSSGFSLPTSSVNSNSHSFDSSPSLSTSLSISSPASSTFSSLSLVSSHTGSSTATSLSRTSSPTTSATRSVSSTSSGVLSCSRNSYLGITTIAVIALAAMA